MRRARRSTGLDQGRGHEAGLAQGLVAPPRVEEGGRKVDLFSPALLEERGALDNFIDTELPSGFVTTEFGLQFILIPILKDNYLLLRS